MESFAVSKSFAWCRRLGLAAVALVLAAQPALACLETPAHPPQVTITGDACTGPLEVRLHDYSTFAASGDFCGCALNIPLFLGTVLSASIVESGTSTPVASFNFASDPNVAFNPPGDWQGFKSAVASVVGGINVDLVFTVQAKEVRCEDFAETLAGSLRDPANGVVAGTGGTAKDGTPNHHVVVVPAGPVSVSPTLAGACPVSDDLPCTVDLITGDMSDTCSTSPALGLATGLNDSNGDKWLEGVFRVALPSGCSRVCAVLDYTERPTGFSFNLGDSSTNNGYGGNDPGANEGAAEVQINAEVMSMYTDALGAGQVDRPVVQELALPDSAYKICVSNQRVSFGQASGRSEAPFGKTLFFLPDPIDGNSVFIGLNRVIKNLAGGPSPASRTGTGLRRVSIVVD